MATKKQSAGILLYRLVKGHPEFFLVHPGGPFWAKKDSGAWSIPKGEFDETEDGLEAAKREFKEETGQELSGEFFPLQVIKQKGGKTIYAWAVEGDADEKNIKSNTFRTEWPPRSGKHLDFPEVDRAEWFSAKEAKVKINERQAALIEEVEQLLEKIQK